MASPGYCKCEERTFLIKSDTQQVKGELRAEGDQRAVRRADTGCKGNHRGRLRQEAVGWVYLQLRLAVLRTKNRAPKPPENGEWLCLASSLHARQLLFLDFNSWSCTRVRDRGLRSAMSLQTQAMLWDSGELREAGQLSQSQPRSQELHWPWRWSDFPPKYFEFRDKKTKGGDNITESQWKFPWPFTR